MSSRGAIWQLLKLQALKRDNKTCTRCGHKGIGFWFETCGIRIYKRWQSDLVIDHIISLALGGENSLDNLQTLCIICNKQKNRFDQSMIALQKRCINANI